MGDGPVKRLVHLAAIKFLPQHGEDLTGCGQIALDDFGRVGAGGIEHAVGQISVLQHFLSEQRHQRTAVVAVIKREGAQGGQAADLKLEAVLFA